MRWGAGMMAVAILTAACAAEGPVQPARLDVAAFGPGAKAATGTLVVRREALAGDRSLIQDPALASGRALLAADDTARYRLVVSGPDLPTPFEVEVSFGPEARVTGVPVGARRLLTFERLDAQGQVVVGGRRRALLAIGAGDNEVLLSPTATLIGDVFALLQTIDGPKGTRVAAELDLKAFTAGVAAYPRALAVAHPGLLSAVAIADAVHAAGGTPPAAQPAFVAAPGRVVLRPKHWPTGLTAVARLGDGVSAPVVVGDRPVELAGLPPGTWSLTLTPARAGLAPLTRTVTITASTVTDVELAFGDTTALANLPRAIGGPAYGVVTVGGEERLLVVGGMTRTASEGEVPADNLEHLGLLHYAAASSWTTGAALTQPIIDQAFAVQGGKLYALGGSGSFVYDPATGAAPQALAPVPLFAALGGYPADSSPSPLEAVSPDPDVSPSPLPTFLTSAPPADETRLDGATAVAQGEAIYVTGGDANYYALSAMLKYTPATDTWEVERAPDLRYARYAMAGAALGGTLYFAGGGNSLGGSFAPPKVTNLLTAYTPDTETVDGRWRLMAPMPTARAGAAAVVAGGRVYVIGGHDSQGRALPDIESYDPVSDTWHVHPPLTEPRAFPAAGLVGGKIVVAGGLKGHRDVYVTAVIASTEAVTP